MTEPALKVGIILPMFSGDPGKVLEAARSAESLGFDGAFAFDHFFPPGGAPDRPALEAFTTLAAVAGVTERVRLGTLVTRAVLRPPGMVAKMAITKKAPMLKRPTSNDFPGITRLSRNAAREKYKAMITA